MEELYNQAGQEQAVGEQEAVQVPEAEVRQVRELIQSLVKTKRAFEMYPANNPMLIKFQDDLQKRFASSLGEHSRLNLVIRQQDIYYKGHSVYHNAEKDDNVALLFYKDGLRELTFSEGLSSDEVQDFLDVIRARPEASTESFDDDVVTLLWEKDFVHLSYYIVEEFVEGAAMEDEEVARLSKQTATDGDLTEAYQDAMSDEQIFSPLESISMGFRGVFSLGEEEVKSLKEEMEDLTDDVFLERAVLVLFESIYLDRGTPDFKILMDNLDSALNYLIYNGGFGMATLIVRNFRELAADRGAFNAQETERIKNSIIKAGDDTRAKAMAETLNSGRDIHAEEFKAYVSQLEKNAILPLTNIVADINDIKYRKLLLDALVSLGRENIEVLASGLKDKRWFVVRNVAAVLGRIGDKAALDHLRQALTHPEPKVRREIVRSLGMVGGPKAGEILLHAIEDVDPQIRMAAIRYLPAAHTYTVLDSLVEIITRPDFPDRALPEKRAFFEVLAEIGQEKVLTFMLKSLKKKGLFITSAKTEETRICAAYALGNIHQKEAVQALKEDLSKSKKGSPLNEALSYSLQKLTGPAYRQAEPAEEE